MAELKISNTLVNDTSDGVIAYAGQLKDKTINKFQSQINQELLEKYAELAEGSVWED